jgi:hypothetical protein
VRQLRIYGYLGRDVAPILLQEQPAELPVLPAHDDEAGTAAESRLMMPLPSHCSFCHALLQGGATKHKPDCPWVQIIRECAGPAFALAVTEVDDQAERQDDKPETVH